MEFDNYRNENHEYLQKEIEKKKLEEEKKNKENEKGGTSSQDKNNEKHLEVKIKIKVNKENDEIYRVYELSDNRLASLKTLQLLTKIKHDNVNNSIELKNKDIAIAGYRIVYFYKLSRNNYINYLKLEEKTKREFMKFMN